MSFAPTPIRQAIARHGRVARVVVAEVSGSAPRDAGAAMLVWGTGQQGTIGGGALEMEATREARAALSDGRVRVRRHPLGPRLGQCCGGAVTLVTEVFDSAALEALVNRARDGWVGRAVDDPASAPAPALGLRHLLRDIRNGSAGPGALLRHGWLLEPLAVPRHALWLHGAGHVGRAIATILAPMPDWQVTWIDTHAGRFPDRPPEGVEVLVAADPAIAAVHAPVTAHHLIVTYSHALDLALCHAVLERGFASAGLIGSATKWRRFRSRLRALGHGEAEIARIACPIGDPELGKHPQAIAIGVSAMLLKSATAAAPAMDRPA